VLQDRAQGGAGHGRADVGRQRQGAAAIHVTPEALDGGAIAKIRDGDMIRLDAKRTHWTRSTP
jgi:phosphogluconate dehydratase